MSEKQYRLDVIDEDNVYICFGLGCMNMGFLTEGYHGFSMKNECCCFSIWKWF